MSPPRSFLPVYPSYTASVLLDHHVQTLTHAPLIECPLLSSLPPPPPWIYSRPTCLVCGTISFLLVNFSGLYVSNPWKSSIPIPDPELIVPAQHPPTPNYPPGPPSPLGGDNMVALWTGRYQVRHIRVHVAFIGRLPGLINLEPG